MAILDGGALDLYYYLGVGATDYTSLVASTSPILHYPMNDVSGNLADAIGSNDATMTGSPTYQVTGPTISATAEKAITFSGSGQYADASDPGVTASTISFLIWVKFTTPGADIVACGRYAAADDSWFAFANSSGEFRFLTRQADSTTHGDASTSGGGYDDGAWHGFIGTFSDGGTQYLYDDVDYTTAVASDSSFAGAWNYNTASSPIHIATVSGAIPWNGSLAHFAFWNKILSSSERQLLLTGSN